MQDKTNLGASIPDSWVKTQAPLAAYNCSSEDAPPFACMQIKRPENFRRHATDTSRHSLNEDENTFFAQEMVGNQLVWLVAKPDAEGTARQNPSQFVFAGKNGIRAHGFGSVYQQYPGRTLHDGNLDRLEAWMLCGPVENEWFVRSTGSAFTCMGHDISSPAGQGAVHTVWVGPNPAFATIACSIVYPCGDFECHDNEAGFLTIPNPENESDSEEGSADLGRFTLSEDRKTLIVPAKGLYQFWWHAAVSSSDASRGDWLRVQAYKFTAARPNDGVEESTTSTHWIGARKQDVEQDRYYGVNNIRGVENVAFSGIEKLRRNDGIKLKNVSDGDLTIQLCGATLIMRRVGEYNPVSVNNEQSLNYNV